MHGVGPSTVLGGRYAVQRRLEQLPRAERWSAHDTTLERDVVLVCFAETEAHAAATLDAARRAAGIDNSRLVRVLDVGRSDGIAFFVEESLQDTHTLTQVLEQGGLPAEEARRIAGEVATGLESARGRGLHHLRLTPSSVLRSHDGTIKVRGLATSAAMAEADDVDSDTAARLDAVGVVAIAYAALTSRWPLPGPVPGLEAAPHVIQGVPAPSEIAAGVPGDLDALCRLTLNEDQGPLTPGDFATQIAPWAMTQVQGFAATPSPSPDVTATIALPVRDLPRVDTDDESGSDAAEAPPAQVDPFAEAEVSPAAPVDHDQTATAPLRFEPAAPTSPDEGADEDRTAMLPRPVPAGAAPPRTGAAAAGSHGPDHPVPAGGPQGHGAHEAPGLGAAAASGAAAAASAVGSALGTAGHAAGHAAADAAHRVGTFARAAADKAAERRAQRQAAEERAEQRRVSLDDALVETGEPLDPPLPMLSPDTAAAPSRDQAKLVLLVIAAFVVVATVIGIVGASRIGANTDLGLGGGPEPRNTVTVTAPPTTVPPSGQGDAGSGDEFPILAATGYDPEGDGSERNGEAPRVYDGKASTFWSSEGYASSNLGGLKKGVGLRLDLGQVRKVSTVRLVLPNTSDVTVSVGSERGRDAATEIGSSSGKDGTVTLTHEGGPVDGQYVFIWFTKVSQVDDGRFRATVAEVTVS